MAKESEQQRIDRIVKTIEESNPELQDYQSDPSKWAAFWSFIFQVIASERSRNS